MVVFSSLSSISSPPFGEKIIIRTEDFESHVDFYLARHHFYVSDLSSTKKGEDLIGYFNVERIKILN